MCIVEAGPGAFNNNKVIKIGVEANIRLTNNMHISLRDTFPHSYPYSIGSANVCR